jgi:hypothetical protein
VTPAPRIVRLSYAIYPPAALARAGQAFREVCEVNGHVIDSESYLTISPVEGAPAETIDEYLSYALSAAIEMHLAEIP